MTARAPSVGWLVATIALTSPAWAGDAAADKDDATPARGPSARLGARHASDRGIAVDLVATPDRVQDGERVHVSFKLKDEATGTPLTGARPAAWLALPEDGHPTDRHGCVAQASRLLGGGLAARPSVDFNSYYVLALNDDASISVVDPRFGFGGSQLLATVQLEGRGEDWALTRDGATLFVSVPSSGKVAVVDTVSWSVRQSILVSGRPSRVQLQPDGSRLWVTGDAALSVIDVATRRIVRTFAGEVSWLAFADHGGPVVVAGKRPALTIIDPRSWAARSLSLDFVPGAVAWSSAAQLAYVGDPVHGAVIAVEPRSRRTVARTEVEPGFAQLRFAPGGRYGFLPNPTKSVVQVLDTASNRVSQTADIEGEPDQVTFTDRLAFVRRRQSDEIMMIPLQRLEESSGIGLASFTGGQHALGAGKFSALADSMVEAPGNPAIFVANPADHSVYYYREGMAAPMGSLGDYGREPRAVLVVDRALRERAGGVYETDSVVDAPGAYEVVFFLDAPRVTACFPLEVRERPETRARRRAAAIVELVDKASLSQLRSGQPARIRFRIEDADTHQGRRASDVSAVVMQAPGVWQRRAMAVAAPDGTYAVDVTPPSAGTYYVWLASPTAGLPLNNPQFVTFEVN